MPLKLTTNILGIVMAMLITCVSTSSALAGGAPAKEEPKGPPGVVSFPSSIGYKGESITLVGKLEIPEDPEDEYRKFPLIIMLHGCIGLNKYTKLGLEAHAKAFKKAGFASLIIDSFRPREINLGWTCKKLGRRANAQGFRKSDVSDALDYLKDHEKIDLANVFIIGQGNGGNTAVFLSRSSKHENIRAVAAYYPICQALNSHFLAPLIVFIAGKDDEETHDACRKADRRNYGMDIVYYEGAHHLFDLPLRLSKYQGKLVGGDKRATRDSRNKIIEFFTKRLLTDEEES